MAQHAILSLTVRAKLCIAGTVPAVIATSYPYYLLPWFSKDNNERGSQFEDLARWWLVANPILSSSSTGLVKVLRWNDWPDRPSIDLGIDLVGWDFLGRLHAIQCKAYELSRLVNKSEVSQLVGAAGPQVGGIFAGLIYLTTSDGYTENAKTIAKSNNVLLLSRSHLELSANTLQFPRSETELKQFLLGETPAAVRATPRKHQVTAVEETVAHMASSSRGQLLMACGTGKTLTALWVKERVIQNISNGRGNAKIVVLVPSTSLIAQTLREWAAHRNTPWKQLAVCSDETVSASCDNNFEDMKSIDAGFRVTTSQDEIRDFIRSTPGPQIIFSTYHSSEKVANAALEAGVTFDLVICDEAHWLAGRAGKSYTSVLDEKLFPAHKRLFITATPKVFSASAKKTASNEGCLISSMDDAAKFGEIAHQLPFGTAIKDGLLTDYRVVVAVTTDAEAKKLLAENRFVSIDGVTMTANDLAAVLAVAKAAQRHNLTRVISFHSSIKRSKWFVDAVKKVCSENLPGLPQSIDAAHVDGSVSATERLRRLDHLKAGTADLNLLANARCLTEGIDVPSLDGVAFVDPRQSEVDITQAVGRAIRPSPNKKKGTIIIPVVMSDKEAAEGKLDASSHKKIRQVLWALRAHDSEIAIAIDEFVFGQASHTSGSLNIATPERIVIEFDEERLLEFANNIRVSILNIGSPDTEWAARYAELEAFRNTHNRWPAQSANGEEGVLARWVGHQRRAHKKNTLSPDRIKRLEELPDWSWDAIADKWDRNFCAVQVFFGDHGRWPMNGVGGEEGVLAWWVGTQRRAWKKNTLSPDRIKRLEELPGWSWSLYAGKWNQNFVEVQVFYDKYKSWPRNDAAGEEGKLAAWVGTQRQAWKKSTLSSERVKRLEGLPGWSWVPLTDKWDQSFVAVQAFRNAHGRWPVREALGEEGALALWVATQRKAWKKDTLSPEQAKRLEELPGWSWDAITDKWNRNFCEVQVFYDKHKRWPTSVVAVDERVLTRWVVAQRKAWKKNKLSPKHAKQLEELQDWSWAPSTDKWDQNFVAVHAFYNKHKRDPVQRAAGEEGVLAAWVSAQRHAFKKSTLSSERVKRLEELPVWSWGSRADIWDRNFEEVQVFFGRHGRWPMSAVAGEEGVLAQWISAQRHAFKKSTLSSECIKRLEELSSWSWDPCADTWNKNFVAAQVFHDKHKRSPAYRAAAEEAALARWVSTQRQAFMKSTLSPERVTRLNSISGWMWSANG